MLDKREFYINGKWVKPAKANDFEVINPATEEPFAVISLGGQADTDAAVAAARNAFTTWSVTSKQTRIDLLQSIYDEYKRRADDMAEAISNEMGAPITLSQTQQFTTGISHIKKFIKALQEFEFEHPIDGHPTEMILHEPIGVCGLITPWNWPMNQICLKVIPAIAVGSTTILKPSEVSPLSAHVFSEIMDTAGCPAGVYNYLNGDGVGVGTQLSSHKDVDMISFTGSTRAGTAITKAAADTVKRVTLELGGKGANVVYADADENAVKRGTQHVFNNTGQSCNAPTRMLVERSIYDNAVEIAAETAKNHPVGNPAEEGPHMGPLVSEAQFNKVQGLIEVGIKEGARLVAGGLGRPEGINKGFFARPTVFADVDNSMQIAQEEIFGPVMVMIPFDDEEQAMQIANDTPYGLTNYVQTQDPEKAKRAARAMRSGMIRMNGDGGAAASPFGGYKQSGNGREGGKWGLEDFLEVKHVTGWNA
ncbi:aldehyde dehydrogenase [Amylibacter kogurei]|uniref:aldehyde dehydrogenase (NAD(+)) n=1 Tax=Paramylibacter kogurei TaxID=1889778 RepID=A0A2G5JZZ4_9RHOB|nr:aldehyde dehydrogenase family protein [Amylibacter kogurei]PIB22848.1 aldehyde dehydrogenase [Amylibacter kogurei]